MESYLRKNFVVEPKRTTEERLRRWRSAVWPVKNPRRRFRMVVDIAKRAKAERERRYIQDHKWAELYVQAKLQLIDDVSIVEQHRLSKEVRQAGFRIEPDDLFKIVSAQDARRLDHHGGVEGVARKISVSLNDGVLSRDIPIRQRIYGVNKFTEKPSRPFWMFAWDALQDLTLIILMVCAVISVGVGFVQEGWPEGLYDGLGIILSIFLVVFVTAISDYKQSLQFKELDNEKKNIMVHVTRDGSRSKVSIFNLVVGDIVHLSIGDQVPADGLYVSGYSLSIDISSLSGESEPKNIEKGRPFLFSGTKVQGGSCKMLVTSVGMRTEWSKLMATLIEGGDDETPLQVKLNGVATIMGKIGLAFAVLTFLVLTTRFLALKTIHHNITNWTATDAMDILNFFAIAVTLLAVAVPEGLPIAVTLNLAFAMKKLMRDMALIRLLSACETMGSATCICTNKTGTLTTDHMVVSMVWVCGESIEIKNIVRGNAFKSSGSEKVLRILLHSIFINNSSEVVKGKDGKPTIIGSPTEKALLEFAWVFKDDFQAQCKKYYTVKVEPFNSVKKKMSVLAALPEGGYRSFCKGGSEIVLSMCDKIIDANGESVPMSDEQRKIITNAISSFSEDALRTICLAFQDLEGNTNTNIIPENGYTLIAILGIKNPVRPEVKKAVQTCLSAGIKVRMVTGDNIHTAKAIARECGILTYDGLAIEGLEFRDKSPQELEEIIPKLQVMARSLPLDKHKLVTHLRNQTKEVVAVTGDGTNDAPALHEADIGIAMGIAGTEVVKESADVVILDDSFANIVNVAKWGRAVYINIQKLAQFQLTVNVVALISNVVSACTSGTVPLTVVQLLWVNLIMDTFGAFALAIEPPHDELMKRPPVGRNVNFITMIMWRNIIGQSAYQLVILGVLQFKGMTLLNLNGPDARPILNTLIFNTFVFCQVFNEINSREMDKINVLRGMFSSWVFLIVLVSTVAFQVIIVEFLGKFAGTVPLSANFWLLSVLVGSVSLLTGAILKVIPVWEPKSIGTDKHHDGYEPLPTGPELA